MQKLSLKHVAAFFSGERHDSGLNPRFSRFSSVDAAFALTPYVRPYVRYNQGHKVNSAAATAGFSPNPSILPEGTTMERDSNDRLSDSKSTQPLKKPPTGFSLECSTTIILPR